MENIRRAIATDAEAILRVALSLSKSEAEKVGASADELSKSGFLLYPLAANDLNKPNYSERIVRSSNFWVAETDGEVIAYIMAYSFDELRTFDCLTDNDRHLLSYFEGTWGLRPEVVYAAQAGCFKVQQRTGLMKRLAEALIKHAERAPAIVAEIAQVPMLNEASSKFAERAVGMKMIATREKDSGTRVSGIFVRTL